MGGIAGNVSEESTLTVKFDGIAEIEDLRIVDGENSTGEKANIVISRTAEMKLIEPKTKAVLSINNIPY